MREWTNQEGVGGRPVRVAGGLCDVGALRAFEGRSRDLLPDEPVHVAVDRGRTVAAPTGITVNYLSDLEVRTAWHLGPPRLHHDEGVIDVAGPRLGAERPA